jgi:hypothetical protein
MSKGEIHRPDFLSGGAVAFDSQARKRLVLCEL